MGKSAGNALTKDVEDSDEETVRKLGKVEPRYEIGTPAPSYSLESTRARAFLVEEDECEPG
jgi:hypothetical protein